MICHKVSYASKGDATKKAGKAGLYGAAYQCTICGTWHLTRGESKRKDHYKKIQKRGGKKNRYGKEKLSA